MKDPEYNMITHTIEVNCLSDNHSTILYKCLSSDESLKHNGMYKHVYVSGSLIKIELQSNTCEDIRYKAKNIYDYLQFFFKTIETFV
ncbi:conserved Plasmodium protein, unknown function [Plasmodium malariae]|uniref:Uncharacterized protein n=1 Tax=Plasmodium malariae TaxID=5858 RepID=A0A1C3KZU2_PLAMA|nr:conserved Plasmodium protein, unknown function [Plasmodium malariae]SBT79800.1 conserved Plasmodium protein, unknown function [Plasmodium malariae]SCO93271.1 conserved Plasmodium protein, unknown function [Plasmodium malariae]